MAQGTPPNTTLPPLLGGITEVCIVTPDIARTAAGLQQSVGIGPFRVFTFDSSAQLESRWRGGPGDVVMKLAFAQVGALTWELIQPISGRSLMAEYLQRNGGREGIQHVAFDMSNLPMAERIKLMAERGVQPAMEGLWKGKRGTCRFVFFDTEDTTGTIFETIEFSKDWEDPEDGEWVPNLPTETQS